MSEDLTASPFGAAAAGKHWLFRFYERLTVPFVIHFVLSSPRLDPAYGMGSAWRRLRFGWRLYRNTRRVFTGISYRAHLVMAVRLLELPPSLKGAVVECGCFRGGTTANLSLICRVVGRELYVYDSFEGLPPAEEGDQYARPEGEGLLDAELEQVKAHVAAHGAPEVCTFVKGWIADTAPHHEPPIVLMFLDVDYQSSLTDCIVHLWPKLVPRGFCFTDEYMFNDYCALFWSERFWAERFDRTPPGLMGSGTGVSVGSFFLGGTGMGQAGRFARPASIAYTRKHWSGHWGYYPAEDSPPGS